MAAFGNEGVVAWGSYGGQQRSWRRGSWGLLGVGGAHRSGAEQPAAEEADQWAHWLRASGQDHGHHGPVGLRQVDAARFTIRCGFLEDEDFDCSFFSFLGFWFYWNVNGSGLVLGGQGGLRGMWFSLGMCCLMARRGGLTMVLWLVLLFARILGRGNGKMTEK